MSDRDTQRTLRASIQEGLAQPFANFYLVLVPTLILMFVGILMVLSSSSVYAQVNENGDPYYFVKRQLIFLLIGIVSLVVLSRVKPKIIEYGTLSALFVIVLLLVMTLLPGFGVEVNGNRNWVQLGSHLIRFQPSEFAKLVLILSGALFFVRQEKRTKAPGRSLIPFLFPVAVVIIGLVVLEKDLGTAMILAAITMIMLFYAGLPIKAWFTMGFLGAVGVAIMVATNGNRMSRIFGFLRPNQDLSGVNQQPLRGIYALASGGWWGVGIGASKQKWGLLVEAHTDYVMAILGEEIGLVGVLSVLLLFLALGYGGFRISLRSDNNFNKYVAAGISSWITLQALVNILVVLRLAPVIGVPLPLISYGGSALLATCIAIGILLCLARNEPEARRHLEMKKTQRKHRKTSAIVVRKDRK